MNRKAIIVPLENKKDQQVSNDIKRTPERWLYMWELIELSIAFSPTKQLKLYQPDDGFITLKRKNVSA